MIDPMDSPPQKSFLGSKILGWCLVMAGGVAALISAIPPVTALKRVHFTFADLNPEWLAGWLLFVVAAILFSLTGASLIRAAWWIALGRFLVAIITAYAAFQLVYV